MRGLWGWRTEDGVFEGFDGELMCWRFWGLNEGGFVTSIYTISFEKMQSMSDLHTCL
jgi:hypothetical protein